MAFDSQKFLRATTAWIRRWCWAVCLVAIAVTALAAPRAIRLFSNIDTDLIKLLPGDYKSVEQIQLIRNLYVAKKALAVIVEGKEPDRAKAYAIDLAQYLDTDPAVSSVEYTKRGYKFFDKHKLLFVDFEDLETIRDRIDRRIQREKLGGLYIDFEDESGDEEFKFGDLDQKYKDKYSPGVRSEYYTNDARNIYVIYVRPEGGDENIRDLKSFYSRMQDNVAKYRAARPDETISIHFTDTIRTRVDEYSTIMRDLGRAGLISGIGIFLILIIYFRRVAAAALVFAPLSIGILCTFAVSSYFIDSLNLITSFLFAILGGLGVEIGIHMFSRYVEERRARRDEPREKATEDSLFTMLYHTGGSALTSAATVAATFFVLMINDFKGFSEFGFIAGIGLVINYLTYTLVFPSILVIAEKIRLLGFKRGIGFDRIGPLKKFPGLPGKFPMPRFVLAGFAALAIITVLDLPRVQFEWRFSQIKANLPDALLAKSKHQQTSSSVNSPAAVVIRSHEEANAVKEAINASKEKAGEANVINAFKSYYDLVPEDQEPKMGVIGEIKDLLADDTLKLVKGKYKKDLDDFKKVLNETVKVENESEIPENVREIFKGKRQDLGYEVAFINPLPKMELDDGRNAIRFAEQIGRIDTPLGSFHPSSDAIVFADVLRTMIKDGKRVVVLAFLIVCAIVFLDFRSLRDTALVVSPIALGVLFTFLIMYLFDIRLNFYNIVVIPTSVGTSIDNSIHLYHRYREMGRGSILLALKSSGAAALTSSLTNIFGFLGLMFVYHSGLRSIGELAVAGLLACLFTTLFFFPALLQFLEDRKGPSATA